MFRTICACVCAAVLAAASPASASLIVYANHSDYTPVPGGSLTDVQMTVDLSVSGSVAVMSFTNTSTGLEESASFKEIVLDTYDDDVAAALLWDPVILTDTKSVGYDFGPSNGLPGFQSVTDDAWPLVEFQADAPPPKMGLNPGESMLVQFATSLPDGSDIYDYLAAFNGGDDTGAWSVGFHAISVDTVGGESVSGMATPAVVPEPVTMTALVLGGAGLTMRRRR